MKGRILLFVFIIIPFLQIIAQRNRPVFKLGIEAGPGITRLKGNEYIEAYYLSTSGFVTGFSLQITSPKKVLSVKSNLFYETKGGISDDIYLFDPTGDVIGITRTKIKLTYITVPLMLRATTRGKIKLFINGGSFVGFLLKDEVEITGLDSLPLLTLDKTDSDNKLDGGLSIGAGFEIPIKEKFSISFEVRDNIGFYDINNTPRTRGGEVETSSINFLFGLQYKIQKKYRRR